MENTVMRITFMVGNGFDKRVGLRSGYDDFYKSLPDNTDNDIINSIKADTELWSDMEETLGKYYSDEIAKNPERFIEQKHELEILLESYLLSEQKRVDYKKSDEIALEMRNSVFDFHKTLAAKDSGAIRNLIGSISGSLQYSFIVFNYTNVFDSCISLMKSKYKEFSHRSNNGSLYTDGIDRVLHVHGKIDDGIVLGIDNVKQTQCQSLGESERVSDYLVKSRLNDIYGELRTEDARKIIDESIIVCIFGLSLGITDNMWWSQLLKLLEKNDKARLVVFTYNPAYRKDIYSKRRSTEELMNRFAGISGFTEPTWDRIKGRIYIGVNPQLFNIKLC